MVFVVLLFLAMFIAGAYGALHDQISFTVSSEYFTKFKFHQFGFENSSMPDRTIVGAIGIAASWWMGFPIGLVVGGCGFVHSSPQRMFRNTMKAFLVVAAVALCVGLTGLVYGWFFASHDPSTYRGWFIPRNLDSPRRFLAVGYMHNFSYLGGVIGLIAGSVFQFRQRSKDSIPLAEDRH